MEQDREEKTEMNTKAEKALVCAQAVDCSFCEEAGVDEETMFRIAEGFGLGMGMTDMCGAMSGGLMDIGMENSVGKLTKADTYKNTREYAAKFKKKNNTCDCSELKGVGSGAPIVSWDQCILDAVAFTRISGSEVMEENV